MRLSGITPQGMHGQKNAINQRRDSLARNLLPDQMRNQPRLPAQTVAWSEMDGLHLGFRCRNRRPCSKLAPTQSMISCKTGSHPDVPAKGQKKRKQREQPAPKTQAQYRLNCEMQTGRPCSGSI